MLARALLKRFQPGDPVAIWAPNSAHWIILQQGISLAGTTCGGEPRVPEP